MRSAFGTTIGAHRFFGGGRLGEVVSDDVRQTLSSTVDAAYLALADALSAINQAAIAGFDTETALAEHDELQASLDRLAQRLPALEIANQQAWEQEASRLFQRANALRSDLHEALDQSRTSRLWKVGLWTGGSVLAAVGAVIWIRSRKRR